MKIIKYSMLEKFKVIFAMWPPPGSLKHENPRFILSDALSFLLPLKTSKYQYLLILPVFCGLFPLVSPNYLWLSLNPLSPGL